jgi:hypothetical protein
VSTEAFWNEFSGGFFMSRDNKTELLDTIFRLFPNACIVRKSKLRPFENVQHEELKSLNGKPPARRRAGRERASAGGQGRAADSYWLFDLDDQRGGK